MTDFVEGLSKEKSRANQINNGHSKVFHADRDVHVVQSQRLPSTTVPWIEKPVQDTRRVIDDHLVHPIHKENPLSSYYKGPAEGEFQTRERDQTLEISKAKVEGQKSSGNRTAARMTTCHDAKVVSKGEGLMAYQGTASGSITQVNRIASSVTTEGDIFTKTTNIEYIRPEGRGAAPKSSTTKPGVVAPQVSSGFQKGLLKGDANQKVLF